MGNQNEHGFVFQLPSRDPDAFGCCSRYRECSDAGHCVATSTDIFSHCAYRKNLETGLRFYGKSENDFSLDAYKEYCNRVFALSPNARKAFDDLLVDFCEYNRGTQTLIVRNSHLDEISGIGLFDFSPLGAGFLPVDTKAWSYKKVVALINSDNAFGAMFSQAKEKQKEKQKSLKAAVEQAKNNGNTTTICALETELKETHGANTKEFLRSWLNNEQPAFRDRLADPYRLAGPRSGAFRYIEEMYHDTMLSSYDTRIYRLSPYAEDGFLSDAVYAEEETRRIKLSHGYSDSDKMLLLGKIQNSGGVQ